MLFRSLPGSTPQVIVVGAHFDHVSEGDGVVDNWSGASLLPSLFQSLMGSARKHTFIFVAFTGEEEGLLGSAFYVKQLSKDQLSNIEAMINLDSLGLGPTEVWVSQSGNLGTFTTFTYGLRVLLVSNPPSVQIPLHQFMARYCPLKGLSGGRDSNRRDWGNMVNVPMFPHEIEERRVGKECRP